MKFKKNKSAPHAVVTWSSLRQHASGTIAAPQARQLFLASASVVALMVLSAGSAAAQTWTGTTSTNWLVGSNWSGGVVPTNGTVTINTTSPNPTVLGVAGAVAATSGVMLVGNVAAASAALTIQNGSTLTSNTNAFSFVGRSGATGVVNVTGPGSQWTVAGVPAAVSLLLGETGGTGTLNVSNGGSVVTAGDLVVGERLGGTGFLSITSGGTVTTGRDAYMGRLAASNGGTATVTGAGSSWTIAARLFVGNGGTGASTLNIADNALVSVGNTTTVADSGSAGTLNITSGGTLQTAWLIGGTGPTQVNFNGGVLQARANNASFISGFAGTELNIASGGLTINTAGFNVGTTATSALTGVGGLAKIGAGTLTLAANNAYTGSTMIQAGTLALTGIGSIANSSRVVANGTFNISGITATGTGIQSLAGSGAVALGAKNLTITNANDLFSGIISGTGGLTVSGGTQTLSGANTFTGGTTITAGTLAVNGSVCGGMNVLAGGRLQGTGTVCDTTNFGTVAPGNSIGTLTVAGNYTGNGGLLEIETVLGGDASPTDRLVVTGATSGSTNVRVINLGGTGAQTVEGIRIVDVGGASNGAFSLQGDFVIAGQQAVIAGAYAYTLQKNGVSTPNDGDWYLRSSLANPAPPAGSPPPPPVLAGPLYQPGVPLYESYGQVLLGLNELSTLQQRAGNRHRGGSDAMAQMDTVKAVATGPAAFGPVWGRFEGRHLNLNPSTTARSTFDADYWKFEGGIDALTLDKGIGKLVLGITGHYNEADANVASFFGNGTIRTRGGGFGGTATWYGNDGFYVDGQARASWYSSNLNSALVGAAVSDNAGFGYALGVESGKRFAIGSGWSVTPQAQLAYSAIDFDTFTDRFGALVSLDRAESLLGRAGVSLDHQNAWRDASGQFVRSDVYGIANLHYEFLDGANVDVSGTRFASSADRLWGSVGAGGTFSWANDRYALYGEVSYNASLDGPGDNYSYKGTAGFRVRW